jgi:hypothetical protein
MASSRLARVEWGAVPLLRPGVGQLPPQDRGDPVESSIAIVTLRRFTRPLTALISQSHSSVEVVSPYRRVTDEYVTRPGIARTIWLRPASEEDLVDQHVEAGRRDEVSTGDVVDDQVEVVRAQRVHRVTRLCGWPSDDICHVSLQ